MVGEAMPRTISVLPREESADIVPATYHKLPVQPTPLIGREIELEAAREMLLRNGMRLLTLAGPPGIGKTRLGVELASRLLSDFPDGVHFVSLAPVSDHTLLLSAIRQALGVKEARDRPLITTLQDYLSDRQVLLVLDNFEQVVAAATDVAELLSLCPHLKIVVTSRQVLNIRSEYAFEVPPLALPNPKHLPDAAALAQYEAMMLFVQRAQAVKNDFQLTSANAHSVAEICLRLDGLPLPIELAAARTKVLSPDAIRARLSHKLQLLTGGQRDLPDRHKTLYNAIEWSHDLLNGSEQRLLRRLSTFVGGCTIEAVERVCSIDDDLDIDALEGITALVDKSLLRRQESVGGELRFWMLEAIREYAQEKLEESGESDKLRSRHADYFLMLVEKAWNHFLGEHYQDWGAKDIEWLDRLETEHNNIRATLDWYQVQSETEKEVDALENIEKSLRLAGGMLRCWFVRGYSTEGRQRLMAFISKIPRLLPTHSPQMQKAYAAALTASGWLALSQGDISSAQVSLNESHTIAVRLNDKQILARVLHMLGALAAAQGDYAVARQYQAESLILYRHLKHKWGTAVTLQSLGQIDLYEGKIASAQSRLEQSLVLSREIGDKFALVAILDDTALASYRQGNFIAAKRLWKESLEIGRVIGFKSVVNQTIVELGWAALHEGNHKEAGALFSEGLTLALESNARLLIYRCLVGFGALADRQSRTELAAQLFGAAEALSEAGNIQISLIRKVEIDSKIANSEAQLQRERWAKTWLEGRGMTPLQASALALDWFADQPQPAETNKQAVTMPLAPPYPDQLTAREVEVLTLLATGLTNADIAQQLYLSPRTIHAHLRSIYNKIQVSGRHAATRYAINHGLVRIT